MNILIIDDARASRVLMGKVIQSLLPAAELSYCINGKSAMLILSTNQNFDLIILDLVLPDISGFQILEFLEADNNKSPVITISDQGSKEILKESLNLGAVDYLTKPISNQQLVSVLPKHLTISNETDAHNILIVDDDDDNLFLLRIILKSHGYKTIEASNGYDAIEKVKSHQFNAILMDIRMPYMDGIEASKKIRVDHPYIPIIAVTAEPLDSVVSRGSAAGIDAFLQKPVIKEVLMETIKRQIENKKSNWHDLFNEKPEKDPPLAKEVIKNELIKNLCRFIPQNFLQSNDFTNIKRQVRSVDNCTVIFIEIRDFTSMSEEMSDEQVFNFLNSYFELIEPIINGFGGNVYQFLGDGIVCTFPLYKEQYTNNAIFAALSVQDQVVIYNRGRLRAGYKEIKIGCGISTGPLAIAICGSRHRFEVGAFGTTMNIATRSQDTCRELGVEITMTSETYDRIQNPSNFLIRPIGSHQLKGIKQTVKLFELFNHNKPDERSKKMQCLSDIQHLSDDLKPEDILLLEKLHPDDQIWAKLVQLKSSQGSFS
jgi:adenylate cyclase